MPCCPTPTRCACFRPICSSSRWSRTASASTAKAGSSNMPRRPSCGGSRAASASIRSTSCCTRERRWCQSILSTSRPADRPLRAQGVHAGRDLEPQQLRPVGRRARQGAGQENSHAGKMRRQTMDQETFNLSIRKFLKMVGVNSQREIEQAVQKALETGKLKGSESLSAKMTLELPSLGVKVPFDGEIRLK